MANASNSSPATGKSGLLEKGRALFGGDLRQLGMLLILGAIFLIFSILTDFVFLSPRNLSNLFVQSATVAVLAIGMTLVMVSGHIDLSVGSVLGFTGALAAIAMIQGGLGFLPTVGLVVLAGAAIGAWHGWWVAYRKVPAFIVTLASMLAFRGAILGLTGGQTKSLEMAPSASAETFRALGQGYLPPFGLSGVPNDSSVLVAGAGFLLWLFFDLRRRVQRRRFGFPVPKLPLYVLRVVVFAAAFATVAGVLVAYMGVPWSILLVVALAAIFHFIAEKTVFGRHLYAIGGNSEAARLSGIPIARRTLTLFMIMGALTALAGVLYTARLNAATTSAGGNAELDAIAATVIGGTSLMGGVGTIYGALIGALVMGALDNGMSLLNLDITWQYVIKGLILLLAVWLDIASRRKNA